MNQKYLLSGLIGMTIASSISSQHAQAQITAEQVATIQSVNSSVISNDAKYIAYVVSKPVDPTKDNLPNQQHLYLYNLKTNTGIPFFTASSVSQVTFRPDKGTITFLSRQGNDKTNSLYEMNVNGGEAQKIFTHSTNILSYKWSNDGKKLVFITTEKNIKPKTTLTYSPTFFEEEFPDRVVYLVNNLNNSSIEKVNVKGNAYMIEWSNDDSKLAISLAPTSSVDDSYMAQKINIYDIANKSVNAIIDNVGKLGQFTFSPNDKQLALVAAYDLHDPTNGSLLIADVKGGKPKVIDGEYQGKYEQIIWTSDEQIHFLASEGTSSILGHISPDGKRKMTYEKTKDKHITSFSLALDYISYTANTPEHPSELFNLHRKKFFTNRLTRTNTWLKDVKLGKQEVVKYKARDGKFEIEGMLIYPLNYEKGKKYPLITVVHGGPESHYSNGWLTGYSMPGQMATAEGYAVFYPNYRGSTGRGVKFTYSSQADLAGKEFDDIVDGVDHLIDLGIVDKNRVGVTGGSYGGYASAWMSTYYSDRFAASVMFVGISNNISKFGTSDIPSEMALVHERGYIWENWKKQLEVSPIYYVDRAQTPILIMHGADDPRVHPAQSMELYRHIKVRKPEVPVRLIYYPGEGHGNARSGSKYDYNKRMMQWFDVYLKTGNKKAPMPSLDLPQ